MRYPHKPAPWPRQAGDSDHQPPWGHGLILGRRPVSIGRRGSAYLAEPQKKENAAYRRCAVGKLNLVLDRTSLIRTAEGGILLRGGKFSTDGPRTFSPPAKLLEEDRIALLHRDFRLRVF